MAQSAINSAGSLRLKQLEVHHAVSALYSTSVLMQPRTTNVYSKFILIHALHVELWQLQRRRSLDGTGENTGQIEEGYQSIHMALSRWKQAWDEDLLIQYPGHGGSHVASKQVGFCREGVHFYFLACAFLQSNRLDEWQFPADERFRLTLHGLKNAREWSQSVSAARGEEPGSFAYIDDRYLSEAPPLDMGNLFRRIQTIADSPVPPQQPYPQVYR
jgi:hypothetical protein